MSSTMNPQSLTERYVLAVGRSVPAAQRAEIEAEVRERIGDEIAAHEAEHPAQEDAFADAERAVLTALGDPARLAATYLGRPLTLIGPRYYLTWLRLLRVVLAIVVPTTAVAVGLGQAIAGEPVGAAIGGAIGSAVSTGVWVFAVVTLVFTLLDRYGDRLSQGHLPADAIWSVDDLPSARVEPGGSGARVQIVGGAIGAVILAVVLIGQELNPFLRAEDGSPVPVLAPGLWAVVLPWMLVLVAAGVAVRAAVERIGRMTWWAAGVNTIVTLAWAVPGLWLWGTGRLVNPGFLTAAGLADAEANRVIAVVIGVFFGLAAVASIVADLVAAARGRVRG